MEELDQHFCAWHLLEGLSERDRRALFSQFRSPDDAYAATAAHLTALGLSSRAIGAWLSFARRPKSHPAWRAMQNLLPNLGNVQVLLAADARYPALLREIPDYPPLLYVRGDVSILNTPQLAIVGSRRCSHSAKVTATEFAKTVAEEGITVTSGGAVGIDAAAHEGALQTGATIAVMATGIDGCYPKAHSALYERIAEHGALITEFRPRVGPKPGHFPRRNRIIAGLAAGTLVVEAALRSGSLITANLALDYNREVFAMPGSINDPRSKGTHALIKQGAKLTETVSDIFEEIARDGGGAEDTVTSLPRGVSAELLELVDYSHTPLDIIAERSAQALATLMPQLLELEIAGYLLQENGGYIRCKT